MFTFTRYEGRTQMKIRKIRERKNTLPRRFIPFIVDDEKSYLNHFAILYT